MSGNQVRQSIDCMGSPMRQSCAAYAAGGATGSVRGVCVHGGTPPDW
ncbi:hypothetical protein ABXR97_20225 (plasmid) [Acinetobacter seifertii]